MATTYFQSAVASDLSLGGSFTNVLAETQPGSASSNSVAVPKSSTVDCFYVTDIGVPGSSGLSAGTFTVHVNVTTPGSSMHLNVAVLRVNSAGVVQATATGTEVTLSAGVKTFTFSSPALGTWSAGDRFAIELLVRNAASSGGSHTTIWEVGGSSDTVVAPWVAGVANNDSGSGSIVLGGGGSESLSNSATASGTITFSGSAADSYQPPGQTFNDTGSGALSFGSTCTESATHTSFAAGVVQLSGARTESLSSTWTSSGTLLFAGSSSDNYVPPSGPGPTLYVDSAALLAARVI